MMRSIFLGTRARRGNQRWDIAAAAAAALLVFAAAAASPLPAPAQDTDQPTPPPESQDRAQPIVGGHDLQPRAGELGKPDVTSKDAQTVDELYQKLIDEERKAGNLPPANASPAKRTPPQNSDQ
ncbi:MAG TPA: hypothetical protein VI113_01645 [Alphaproteobacteria bacterium]